MTPIDGQTVFMDASSKAAVVWHISDSAQWHKKVLTLKDPSMQILELAAIFYGFQLFSQELLNIVTHSSYSANVIFCLESSYLRHVNDPLLFTELQTL